MKGLLAGILLVAAVAFTGPAQAAQEYILIVSVCEEVKFAIGQDVAGQMAFVTPEDYKKKTPQAAFMEDLATRVDGILIDIDHRCGMSV